jgi:hypothetical protein
MPLRDIGFASTDGLTSRLSPCIKIKSGLFASSSITSVLTMVCSSTASCCDAARVPSVFFVPILMFGELHMVLAKLT